MTSMAVSDREFGELLGKVNAIQKDVTELETSTKSLDGKVDGLIRRFDQIDGGMKVAIWFSGIIGALAMFGLTKVAPLLIGALPKI